MQWESMEAAMNEVVKATAGLAIFCMAAGCAQTERPLIDEGTQAEVITEGYQFTEGPYWHEDGYLLFSDIPANRIYRWTPGGEAEVYLEPSGNSNGIQADIHGSLLIVQHAGRLSRVTDDLQTEVLVDNYEGNRLNSPNDLAIRSDNTVYFTDPPFGVSEEDRELDFSGVFRFTPGGELSVIYDGFNRPNGIVFSPDETRLYVNDTETGNIIVMDVDQDGNTSGPRQFASVGPGSSGGAADGMVTDTDGRLYTTSPAGLSVFDASGGHLQDIDFPHRITNLEWGGQEHNHLYATSPDRVFRMKFNVTGHKRR
ncbi:MAG: SMP-30/gluconolactonase/LRE family protein [Balneolales bacterium]